MGYLRYHIGGAHNLYAAIGNFRLPGTMLAPMSRLLVTFFAHFGMRIDGRKWRWTLRLDHISFPQLLENSLCSDPGREAIRMLPSKISPISCDSGMRETIAPAAVHRDLTTTLVPLFPC
jgi:hypothetical protein